MNELKEKLRRTERLAEIRQSFLTAAEGRVREAEQKVQQAAEAAAEKDGQIRQTQAEIAYLDHASGASIQNRERYIFGLFVRARQAHETLEKARIVLEARRRRQAWPCPGSLAASRGRHIRGPMGSSARASH